jgi:hypothetical protein
MTPQLDIPCMLYPLMSGVYERSNKDLRSRCNLQYSLRTDQADSLFSSTLYLSCQHASKPRPHDFQYQKPSDSKTRLSDMVNERIEDVPFDFPAPFSEAGATVSMERDRQNPSYFVGTVPENHPYYQSIITVTAPSLPSGQAWSEPSVKSFLVDFPKSQLTWGKPSFSLREDIGWSCDGDAGVIKGTATEFTGFNGELLDGCVKARPEKFQVNQNLVLDPHFASFMTDEEPKRFKESSVSDEVGETLSALIRDKWSLRSLESWTSPATGRLPEQGSFFESWISWGTAPH